MVPRLAVRATLSLLATAAILAGAGGSGAAAERQATEVPVAGIVEHLRALQRIATRNGGSRAAGTAGYETSARYVAGRLRAAGYRVRVQRFTFPFVADRSPPVLERVGGAEWSRRSGRDYATLAYSASGRVQAPLVAVDLLVPSRRPNSSTSGCERADFVGFPPGSVALVQRGTCTFRQKIANAIAAGASAAIVMNEGAPGRGELFAGTLGPPQVGIPVLAAAYAVGEDLRGSAVDGATGAIVRIVTDVVAEQRRTSNVLAESRTGDPANVVMVGAHLDSVDRGPGINDNGSGSATILEIAEQLAGARPRNRLRFAWWGAEELGLVGSRHYVGALGADARRAIALYLNLDMVGSRNYVSFVYDGDGSRSAGARSWPAGSAAVERALARAFASRGLPRRETGIGGSSDHAPFAAAGIPVGGLFSGAEGRKSRGEAAAFGGRAGRPYDPCYHRACDTLANVNRVALARMAGVAADAIVSFSQDVSTVRTRR